MCIVTTPRRLICSDPNIPRPQATLTTDPWGPSEATERARGGSGDSARADPSPTESQMLDARLRRLSWIEDQGIETTE